MAPLLVNKRHTIGRPHYLPVWTIYSNKGDILKRLDQCIYQHEALLYIGLVAVFLI